MKVLTGKSNCCWSIAKAAWLTSPTLLIRQAMKPVLELSFVPCIGGREIIIFYLFVWINIRTFIFHLSKEICCSGLLFNFTINLVVVQSQVKLTIHSFSVLVLITNDTNSCKNETQTHLKILIEYEGPR